MTDFKLVLVNYGEIDVQESIPMSLTFDLNDIKDIANRKGVWSKSVKIYGTNDNNAKFGAVFSVNQNTLTFNPKRSEPCFVSIGGQTVFEGIFQLIAVERVYNADTTFWLEYTCQIKSETANFYVKIDGLYLTDLDVSQYDHIMNYQTVYDSMISGNATNGYQYFLAYLSNETSTYRPNQLNPALYAKVIWDKIFEDAGFSYTFPELYDINFDKLIVPFNGEFLNPKTQGFNNDLSRAFRAGIDSSLDYFPLFIDGSNNDPYNLNANAVTNFTYNVQTLLYDQDDSAANNWFDYSGLFNSISSYYDITGFIGIMEFNTRFSGELFIQPNGLSPLWTEVVAGNITLRVRGEIQVYDINQTFLGNLNSDVVATFVFSDDQTNVNYRTFNSNQPNSVGEIFADFNGIFDSSFYAGASLIIPTFSFTVEYPVGYRGFTYDDGGFERYFNTTFSVRINPQPDNLGHFTNSPTGGLSDGSPVSMNQVLPKKIKQSEFITGIVRMFNLFIVEDKNNNTNLVIKTRDRFYEDGAELVWTSKIHKESIKTEFLSNTQSKIKKFSYKADDKDIVLKAYNSKTNEIYGQLEYVFDNDFTSGETKVEPLFSPTILAPINGKNLPLIDANSPKNNVRILYVGDVIRGSWNYEVPNVEVSTNQFEDISTPGTYYRYVGHLYPNANTPEEDINFGVCDFYAHNYSTITNNNLFNRFYRTQYNIFDNGFKMTAKFNLNQADIYNLVLDERIYIFDSWWNINKINNYLINKSELTEVELISADSTFSTFVPGNIIINDTSLHVNEEIGTLKPTNTYSKGVYTTTVIGSGNVFGGGTRDTLTVGSRNRANTTTSLIVGGGNRVQGSNISVLSLDGQTFDESNRVYANTLIRVSNFISAGRDEVLNPYPDNKVVNIISAGRDEVRPLGSHTLESKIDAGRDKV